MIVHQVLLSRLLHSNYLCICFSIISQDEDLELIFSRFGEIRQCEIIRDYKTGKYSMYVHSNECPIMMDIPHEIGNSLNYAFIEFMEKASAEQAYFKMNNVLIDDRRIKV